MSKPEPIAVKKTINLQQLKGHLLQPALKVLEKIDGLDGLQCLDSAEQEELFEDNEILKTLRRVADRIEEYLP